MEITFDKINLTDIGIYTAITSLLFFALRQYLSTSVSEKVKIKFSTELEGVKSKFSKELEEVKAGFSKELKEFETKEQRSNQISVQHRELEREVIIEFHSVCSEQAFKLLSNVNTTLKEMPQRYMNKYTDINNFQQKSIFLVSKIQLLLTNEDVIETSRQLMGTMIDYTVQLSDEITGVILALNDFQNETEKGPAKSNERLTEIRNHIEAKITSVNEYMEYISHELYPKLKIYRNYAKTHLLA
jgi:hypothetical protein